MLPIILVSWYYNIWRHKNICVRLIITIVLVSSQSAFLDLTTIIVYIKHIYNLFDQYIKNFERNKQ